MTDDNIITAQQYHAEIRSICQSALDEYKGHHEDDEPDEWFHDWLHQTIDGHQWIIYTHYNSQVLTHSDNRDAAWEIGGETPQADSYGQLMAVLAFYAMSQDVQDHMDMSTLSQEEAS